MAFILLLTSQLTVFTDYLCALDKTLKILNIHKQYGVYFAHHPFPGFELRLSTPNNFWTPYSLRKIDALELDRLATLSHMEQTLLSEKPPIGTTIKN